VPKIPSHTGAIGLSPLVHAKHGHIHKINPSQSQLNENPKQPKGAIGVTLFQINAR
jgi:hypothetical protein